MDSDAPSVVLDEAPVVGPEPSVECAAEPAAAEAVIEDDGNVEPESDTSEAAEPTDSDADLASVSSVISVVSTEPKTDENAEAAETDPDPGAETSGVSPEPNSEEPAIEAEPAIEPGAPPVEPTAEPAAGDDPVLRAVIEAIVYVTEEPVTAAQIAAVVKRPEADVKGVLDALVQAGAAPERGIAVREIAGGYKMATKAEHHEMLRAFAKSLKPPLKLSLAALETLATIAYKQPITAPEIMEIRGVQGAGVLKTLLDRKLIQTAGRKSVVGKPILYRTTKEFLVQFGLKDLSELPTLKEFEELRRLAASEPEIAVEEAPETAATETPQPETAPAETAVEEEVFETPVGESAAEAPADEAVAEAPQPEAAAETAAEEALAEEASGAEAVAEERVAEEPAEAPAAEEQTASEDANAPGTAPEDSGERRGDEPAES